MRRKWWKRHKRGWRNKRFSRSCTRKWRSVREERRILHSIWKDGLDEEDGRLLRCTYERLQGQDDGCSWLSDTLWIPHPHILFCYHFVVSIYSYRKVLFTFACGVCNWFNVVKRLMAQYVYHVLNCCLPTKVLEKNEGHQSCQQRHVTGSARSEGFYKINWRDKLEYLKQARTAELLSTSSQVFNIAKCESTCAGRSSQCVTFVCAFPSWNF